MNFPLDSQFLLEDDWLDGDENLDCADDFDLDFDEDYEFLSDEEFEVSIEFDEYEDGEVDAADGDFCLDDFDDFGSLDSLSDEDYAAET